MSRANSVIYIIFFTIVPCDAKISLNITVFSFDYIKVKPFGEDNKLLTMKEVNLFDLNDDILKWGVRVELGRKPVNVFLKNPTTYGDLYTSYDWEEVKRNLRVKRARVIDVSKKDIVNLKTHVFINNASDPIKTKARIFEKVQHAVSSTWSVTGLPSDEIFYKVNITFHNGVLAYENKWLNSTSRIKYLSLGVGTNTDVTIAPGQEIAIQLSAYKLIVTIEVIYEARLIGNLIANYAQVYGKYHFWAPKIDDIMKRAGMKNSIETREVVEIRCFTDPKITVFDKLTGKKIPIMKYQRIPLQSLLHHKIRL